MNGTRPRRACSVATAMVLAAGGVCPIAAASGVLAVSADRTAILLDGRVVHEARGLIIDHRVLTFAGSPTVMVTWREGGERGAGYYAISRTGERFDQISPAGTTVRLRYASFDPLAEEPLVLDSLRAGPENELFLVQFVGTPLEEMREEIRAMGGRIERFLTDNTHLVRMSPHVAVRTRELPYVRWVGDMHPAYRVDGEILAMAAHRAGRGRAGAPAMDEDDPIRYSIECVGRGIAEQQIIGDFITGIGGLVEPIADNTFRMEATLTFEQVLRVAHRSDVGFIEPWGPCGVDMDIARQIGGAVPILSSANITGEGVRGEVMDSDVQMDHPEWNGQEPLLHGPVVTSSQHGSTTYGIVFATGVVMPQATGMLPGREQGVFGSFHALGGLSRPAYNLESVDPAGPYRVVFQTNSWGGPQVTTYTTRSAEMDDAIFQSALLVTQSQSNTFSRNSRPEAWAKNAVSVGGIMHHNTLTREDDTQSGSSFGPAADGRVKPDLVHFYDNIFTTTGGSGYSGSTPFGGTSASTPITAGHFGLLFQMWHEGVFAGHGGGSSVFDSRPHYDLARAIAFATAFRYQWINPPHPNWSTLTRNVQGWGMIDVGRMFELREASVFVNADRPVANAQSQSMPVLVPPGTPELLISMAYTDPPGMPGAAQARINNLDLRVTAPGGAIYRGNAGLHSGNWSIAGGAPNSVDTVENVFIQNPQPGEWLVEVIGEQVVADTVPSQPGVQASFGLAVFGGTRTGGCYANCDQSTAAPVLNVDDFTCFINEFAEAQGLPVAQQLTAYANCDGSINVPVLNVDDFTCFINEFAQGCN